LPVAGGSIFAADIHEARHQSMRSPQVWHGGGSRRRWRSTACFSGWPVWNVGGDGGDGRRRAANDGGGDVQRTTPGTSGSVGEHRDGRRVAAVDDDGGSGGGGQGVGIIIILWLEMCGRRALRQV
jgi:hypothetical protein